jgi:hypothetical protein
MKVIRTALFSVLKRFPEHQNNAKRLFRESERFRTICEDFDNCVQALDHWNRSKEELAPIRRAEYSGIVQELEDEILKKLKEFGQ